MRRIERPRPLTILAPLAEQDDASVRAFDDLLRTQGRAIFANSPSTHFGNLLITRDADHGHRLLLSSNYDGQPQDYLAELWAGAPDEMDAIFEHCRGYTGRSGFADFVRRNEIKVSAYFVAFADESVASIKEKAAFRRELEEAVDDDPKNTDVVLERIKAHRRPPPPPRSRAVAAAVALGRRIGDTVLAALFRVALGLVKAYGQRAVSGRYTSAASDVGQIVDVERERRLNEVITNQIHNQMAHLQELAPRKRLTARLAVLGTNILGRYGSPPGELAGVRTVHFARLAIVDGGKRLFFQGNFDGNWEAYMGDFADRIDWALDRLWGNSIGYPEVGMRDFGAFKRFIRDREFVPSVVYSAYPELTNLAILRDREIYGMVTSGDTSLVDDVAGLL